MYDFYLDVYFVETFVQTYLLLRVLCLLMTCSATRVRCGIAAGIISASAVVGVLLLPLIHMTGTMLVLVAANTLMVRFGCKIKEGKRLIQGILLYYTGMAVSQLLFSQIRLFTGTAGVRAFTITALLSYAVLSAIVSLYEKIKQINGRIWSVTLYQEGRCARIKGLYDTGNLLWDPVVKKDVSVIGIDTLKELFTDRRMLMLQSLLECRIISAPEELKPLVPHFVTYRCVGCKTSVLPVIVLEKICLEKDGIQKMIQGPAVAIDRRFSSSPRSYQMILNPNLVNR